MWSSQTNTAQHAVVPPHEDTGRVPPELPISPGEAAAGLLAAIDSSTEVVVDGTAEVAGRAAYELVVSPRDDRSLIEDVRLAVDGATSMPLARTGQLHRRGGASVRGRFHVGDVRRAIRRRLPLQPAPGRDGRRTRPGRPASPQAQRTAGRPRRSGRSAAAHSRRGRLDIRAGGSGRDASGGDQDGVVDAILAGTSEVSGSYGSGRLLETELVSVLLLDDGRLLVGAVEPDVLFDAAAGAAS